jgi:hypothetical protein
MITRDLVHEAEVHQFVCEASDLYDVVPAIRRGWPEQIPTNLGNQQPFLRQSKKVDDDGDVVYVRYAQALGCITLVIFND